MGVKDLIDKIRSNDYPDGYYEKAKVGLSDKIDGNVKLSPELVDEILACLKIDGEKAATDKADKLISRIADEINANIDDYD